jgi:sec-independent protein translocase protein TatA
LVDRWRRSTSCIGGRGKIADATGDIAKGIKAFKRGLADDAIAEAAPNDDAATRTINHPTPEEIGRSETESKF